MPRLDAHIPAGALTPAAEAQLLSTLTDLLIRHEGGDPKDPLVRSIAWVFLHRPEAVCQRDWQAEQSLGMIESAVLWYQECRAFHSSERPSTSTRCCHRSRRGSQQKA